MSLATQALTTFRQHLAWYNRAVTTRDFTGFTTVLHPDVMVQVLPSVPIIGRSAVMDLLHRSTPAHALGTVTTLSLDHEIQVTFSWAVEPQRVGGIAHVQLSDQHIARLTVELAGLPHAASAAHPAARRKPVSPRRAVHETPAPDLTEIT